MTISTIVVRNPQAALVLEPLLRRAIETIPGCAPGGFETITQSLLDFIVNPMKFMMVGFEDNEPKALCLWVFPVDPMFPYPTVLIIYNEGTQELKKALVKDFLDTIYEVGYDRVMVVNSTGHSTDVWARSLVPADRLTYKVIGEAVELTFKGREDVEAVADDVRGQLPEPDPQGHDPGRTEGAAPAVR